jgi:ribosomal protein S18 acetylase RimI-like enzyme
MALIAIAHPKFRPWLVEQAKRYCLVSEDQAVNSGSRGEYPAELETQRTTRTGLRLKFRPVKLSDEALLKEFFYGLSPRSMSLRFASTRRDMPHERLQKFTVIDYTRELEILAVLPRGPREEVVGVGAWYADDAARTAEVAFAVKDEYQNRGIGSSLLEYLKELGQQQGFRSFTAEVVHENTPMMRVLKDGGFVAVDSQAGTNTLRLLMSVENGCDAAVAPAH